MKRHHKHKIRKQARRNKKHNVSKKPAVSSYKKRTPVIRNYYTEDEERSDDENRMLVNFRLGHKSKPSTMWRRKAPPLFGRSSQLFCGSYPLPYASPNIDQGAGAYLSSSFCPQYYGSPLFSYAATVMASSVAVGAFVRYRMIRQQTMVMPTLPTPVFGWTTADDGYSEAVVIAGFFVPLMILYIGAKSYKLQMLEQRKRRMENQLIIMTLAAAVPTVMLTGAFFAVVMAQKADTAPFLMQVFGIVQDKVIMIVALVACLGLMERACSRGGIVQGVPMGAPCIPNPRFSFMGLNASMGMAAGDDMQQIRDYVGEKMHYVDGAPMPGHYQVDSHNPHGNPANQPHGVPPHAAQPPHLPPGNHVSPQHLMAQAIDQDTSPRSLTPLQNFVAQPQAMPMQALPPPQYATMQPGPTLPPLDCRAVRPATPVAPSFTPLQLRSDPRTSTQQVEYDSYSSEDLTCESARSGTGNRMTPRKLPAPPSNTSHIICSLPERRHHCHHKGFATQPNSQPIIYAMNKPQDNHHNHHVHQNHHVPSHHQQNDFRGGDGQYYM